MDRVVRCHPLEYEHVVQAFSLHVDRLNEGLRKRTIPLEIEVTRAYIDRILSDQDYGHAGVRAVSGQIKKLGTQVGRILHMEPDGSGRVVFDVNSGQMSVHYYEAHRAHQHDAVVTRLSENTETQVQRMLDEHHRKVAELVQSLVTLVKEFKIGFLEMYEKKVALLEAYGFSRSDIEQISVL